MLSVLGELRIRASILRTEAISLLHAADANNVAELIARSPEELGDEEHDKMRAMAIYCKWKACSTSNTAAVIGAKN